MADSCVIMKSEWAELEQAFEQALLDREHRVTAARLKDEPFPREVGFGRFFCNYFPDAADYMAEWSNLGTPAGVYNPNDDDILRDITDKEDATYFILERIQLVEG